MKAYMVYEKDEQGEAAMLVFANSAQEARKESYGLEWCNCNWIDWRATLIKELPSHLAALDNNRIQVVTAPPACKSCGYWGGHRYPDGCSICYEPVEVEKPDG